MERNAAQMKRILIIIPTMPFPLRANGVTLRYFPLIRRLSSSYSIDIIVLDDKSEFSQKPDGLAPYCRRVCIISNPGVGNVSKCQKFMRRVKVILPWNPPIHFVVHYEDYLLERIKEFTSGIHYHALIWASGHYSGHLSAILKLISVDRFIMDWVDSPSLAIKRGFFSFPLLLQTYEYWRAILWEARGIRKSSLSIYISPSDASSVPFRMTPGSKRCVLPNGVSFEDYTHSINEKIQSPNIGFLGNMSYGPNIEAVHWLHEKVFLPLRSEVPNLSLYLIGRNPVESIQQLGRTEGVIVTGEIDDIWPYANGVDIFVFPVWKGIGLKNKVLEAMYAKKPVVTTPVGNEGIDAAPGRDLLICNSSESFHHEVLRLLVSADERAALGYRGHVFVSEKFSWDRILRGFEAIISGNEQTGSYGHGIQPSLNPSANKKGRRTTQNSEAYR